MERTTPHPTQSHAYQRRWWTLGTLSLSLVIIGLDNTILNVAIPTLQREFEASASELQWMVDAYILVFAGLLLTMGSLGDRFGRKRALQVGLVVFGLSSLSAAYADNGGQLIAARAVMGVGSALIMPATLSIITNVFPREERGKAIGVWAAVAGLGIGLGPLVGGLLLEHFWWGSVFLVNIPVVAVALALVMALVPESRDPNPRALDLPGAVLSIGAISSLVYGLIEAPARGWADPVVLSAFGGGALLGAAFALRELRTDHPMLDLEFFKNPRFSAGAGAIAVASFALFGAIFGLTQYLQFVQGYTPLEAGMRTTPIALGIAMGAGNSHRLVRRLGTARVVAMGLLVVATLFASYNFWGPDTAYWIIGLTFFGTAFGMGIVMAPSTDAVMGAVPEARAGIGSAMNDVTRQVSGAFGVAVIGSVMYTIYSSRIEDAVAGLSPQAADLARDSIGAAAQIAALLPPEIGVPLAESSRAAFTDALGLAVLIGTGIAVVGAAMVARFMPPAHLPMVRPAQHGEGPASLEHSSPVREQPD